MSASDKRRALSPATFAIVASLVVIAATALLLYAQKPPPRGRPLPPTVADLSAVHPGVTIAGAEVRRVQRLSRGDVVETDAEGRARLRLDDGTAAVIDRSTKLTITEGGIALERGRMFLQGAVGARAAIDLGGATAIVSGTDAGIERAGDGAKVYAPSAELTVRARGAEPGKGAETTVHAGETATVQGANVTVAPERGYDDWTGGMAAPWGAQGAPRRAVGELWGRAEPGNPGSPLTIRAHDVRATVTREIAETEIRSTFFNAGSATVSGDFRMAVPPGAIVSRFATVRGSSTSEGKVALAARRQSAIWSATEVLEWAGEGWVRGTVPSIAPGATVTVIVGYVEWLTPRPKAGSASVVVQYRYPMASDAAPPLIGEFSARVDATPSAPISIASGLGGNADGRVVELRRPDFRPTADLVVDVEITPWLAEKPVADPPEAGRANSGERTPARLYAAPAGDDDAGGTLVVRADTPAPAKAADAAGGVTLALVLDVSASIDPALLDAERALATAVLQGLGSRDRAVVLAADQTVHAVGPSAMGPVDAGRRKAIADGLAALSPGGATDLGRAIEAGADALPADAPAAMVIYVGDGWPTVGDTTIDRVQARLARRPGGAPRLGAVAVGPLVNRFALAALVRGSGPLLEIADAEGAARAAITLLSDALRPTIAGVEIAFGPEVERIYPRGPRAVAAGETVTAVGRFRDELPKEITLRWRDEKGAHEEKRPLVVARAPNEADVARRWAAARVEEIALRGKGREAATDVALRAGLLTPWTGFVTNAADSYVPTPLAIRILDLAVGPDAGFSASFATPRASAGSLAFVPETEDGDGDDSEDSLKAAILAAASHVIDAADAPVRACRNSRAALRPELSGTFTLTFDLDGDGHASSIKVRGTAGDEALDRCIEVVIEGLPFPAGGVKVKYEAQVGLPAPRASMRGRKCSPTSTLPMPLRRGVWRERLDNAPDPQAVYLEAKQSCELPTWSDRRALLELILTQQEDGPRRLIIARALENAGEADAAALLRKEAVRRARSADELRTIQRILIGDERYPVGAFRKQYKAAADDRGRLAVVRRFLTIAPHDARLRRRLLALLESLGMKQELADEVRRFRRDPFTDAGLLADSASALRRAGDEGEARRAFGELAERAPDDPWARAFLGDRLRNEGWFDDATAAFAMLEELLPDDPASILRLSLAHAGAGRLDIAERMLARVAQTGGRTGDARLGELAGRLASALLAEARAKPGVAPDDAARLARAALELPYPAGATIVLVRTPASGRRIDTSLVRGPNDARELRAPEASAEGVGLYAFRIDPGDTSEIQLRLRRPADLAPARPTRVRVDALVPAGDDKPVGIVTTEIDLPITGKQVTLKWAGGAWIPG